MFHVFKINSIAVVTDITRHCTVTKEIWSPLSLRIIFTWKEDRFECDLAYCITRKIFETTQQVSNANRAVLNSLCERLLWFGQNRTDSMRMLSKYVKTTITCKEELKRNWLWATMDTPHSLDFRLSAVFAQPVYSNKLKDIHQDIIAAVLYSLKWCGTQW